jgi:hypothetical protein
MRIAVLGLSGLRSICCGSWGGESASKTFLLLSLSLWLVPGSNVGASSLNLHAMAGNWASVDEDASMDRSIHVVEKQFAGLDSPDTRSG